ncbi:GNAT family N-acetyltransferase [Cytobacillus gottheilii]|uniref:GNAT family N-acetyltransferase n=1 Tax=Cytobacillus gottheilii TaxID=859144 RepID=A0ABX8FHG3_9BACI|nr:GNAT family N-acetyltransferase [Cytobacillus gottheilii]QVY63445.1 GNAT family N-acetyltransferase [Cytobacillus gottheilii]
MSINIRKATLNDALLVTKMTAELLSELKATTISSDELMDVCLELLKKEEEQWTAFLAFKEDECVGVLTLFGVMALYAPGSLGIIQELYVAPKMRSEGVGEQLIVSAKEHGKKFGWINLEVGTPNPEAWSRTVSFYKRLGFKEIGPRLKYHLN